MRSQGGVNCQGHVTLKAHLNLVKVILRSSSSSSCEGRDTCTCVVSFIWLPLAASPTDVDVNTNSFILWLQAVRFDVIWWRYQPAQAMPGTSPMLAIGPALAEAAAAGMARVNT